MKKLATFLVMLFIAVPLLADDDFGFRFGLKASPNLSWFRTETRGWSNSGVDLGFSYGLIVDYELTQNYAISTGINILRTGGTLRYRYMFEPGTQNIDTEKVRNHYLRYLELPVTLKLRTSEIGYLTYYGQFGLGLGFNIRARADDKVDLLDGESRRWSDVDIADDIRFFRAALVMGAGVEYGLGGRTSLMGGITFHNGFSNVISKENPFDPASADPSSMNNYIEITLGVMF